MLLGRRWTLWASSMRMVCSGWLSGYGRKSRQRRKAVKVTLGSYGKAVQSSRASDRPPHAECLDVFRQPGSFLPLGTFPTTTLSPTDCFHPSAQAHERVATGLWNRLVLSGTQKRVPMAWDNEAGFGRRGEEGRIRCLAEADRLQFD